MLSAFHQSSIEYLCPPVYTPHHLCLLQMRYNTVNLICRSLPSSWQAGQSGDEQHASGCACQMCDVTDARYVNHATPTHHTRLLHKLLLHLLATTHNCSTVMMAFDNCPCSAS